MARQVAMPLCSKASGIDCHTRCPYNITFGTIRRIRKGERLRSKAKKFDKCPFHVGPSASFVPMCGRPSASELQLAALGHGIERGTLSLLINLSPTMRDGRLLKNR